MVDIDTAGRAVARTPATFCIDIVVPVDTRPSRIGTGVPVVDIRIILPSFGVRTCKQSPLRLPRTRPAFRAGVVERWIFADRDRS